MVSRLLGKLDAHRQRTLGSDGACAMACETAAAPAAAAALPAMNLRRFMGTLLRSGKSAESMRIAAREELTYGRRRCRPGCRMLSALSLLSARSVSTAVPKRRAME